MKRKRRSGSKVNFQKLLVCLILVATVSLPSLPSAIATDLLSQAEFISKKNGRTKIVEFHHPSTLKCLWKNPETDAYGTCEYDGLIKYRYIMKDGRSGDGVQSFAYWRAVYNFSGKIEYGTWYSLQGREESDWFLKNSYQWPATSPLFILEQNRPELAPEIRFYGPGEMSFEFSGFKEEYCAVANCRGFTDGYNAKVVSSPKIKLEGPTKKEASELARQAEEEEETRINRIKEEERLRELRWEYGKFNDGIDTFVYVDQQSDGYDKNNTVDNNSTLRIFCKNKRLGAWISIDYADARGWRGVSQVRFGSKGVINVKYTLARTFDLVYLDSPSSFVTNLLKVKKVTIKIPTVDGSEVLVFNTGDLIQFRSKFKARGCALG